MVSAEKITGKKREFMSKVWAWHIALEEEGDVVTFKCGLYSDPFRPAGSQSLQ